MYYHGHGGSIEVGAEVLGQIQNWTYREEDVAPAEGTGMGEAAATPVMSGCNRGTGSIEVAWDDADTALEAIQSGATVTVALYPRGKTAGFKQWTGNIAVLARDMVDVPKGDLIMSRFDYQGVLAFGEVPV